MDQHLPSETAARPHLFEPRLSAAIRERFLHVEADPIAGKRIYLENGGGSLRLKAAIDKANEILGLPDSASERTTPVSQYLAKTIAEGKRDMHCLFGSGGEGTIIAGPSGTALFFRLIGAIAKSGNAGSFVSSSLEHPATSGAAEYWAAETGRSWDVVSFSTETASVSPGNYAACVSADTVLVTIVHTSHLSGMRADIGAIARAVRAISPDCFILCDGIQHAPHGPISVVEDEIDGYVFAPYKAFSRRGSAFAWIAPRLAALPHDNLLNQPKENWELGGPDPSIYGSQSEVHSYLCWLGAHFTNATDDRSRVVAAMQAINRHEAALLELLFHGRPGLKGLADHRAITIVGRSSAENREGAVCFALRGYPSMELVAELDRRGIRTHYRLDAAGSSSREILKAIGQTDCVRVTVGHTNTPEEIETFLMVIADIVATTG